MKPSSSIVSYMKSRRQTSARQFPGRCRARRQNSERFRGVLPGIGSSQAGIWPWLSYVCRWAPRQGTVSTPPSTGSHPTCAESPSHAPRCEIRWSLFWSHVFYSSIGRMPETAYLPIGRFYLQLSHALDGVREQPLRARRCETVLNLCYPFHDRFICF